VSPLADLRRRSAELELLDQGTLPSSDLLANLRDIARINRLPGGTGASIAAIRRRIPDAGGTVLDVGTGAADIPRALVRRVPAVMVTAIDRDRAIVELAQRWCAGVDRLRVVEADGLALPFEDGSFDVAHASLVVHHLDPPEVVMLLRELHRVSRRGVVVNDLRRGWFPYAVALVTVRAFGRSAVTRNDGPLSVRRSYTLREQDRLAADAGLRPVDRSLAIMPRVVTVYR
jgi:ubiquinone/menaquinone biosynthesis C-methylase UbiE